MNINSMKFYIDGAWVDPAVPAVRDVINPATEEPCGRISMGTAEDVDRAVVAARRAFISFSQTNPEDRIALLCRIVDGMEARADELAAAMTREIGTPITFARNVQFAMGVAHFREMIEVLGSYRFESVMHGSLIRREPIGVCGLITPWNWPLNQLTAKVAPAIAAGCTVVLKPSEISPLSAIILTEIIHEAGTPKGVFNLINGDGPGVGEPIAAHADIDMVSFTGSTRAGVLVALAAAPTVKRVCQELGGKSPNIILKSANLIVAVPADVLRCFANAGQSCIAPTRMLVHRSQRDEAVALAKATAEQVRVGDPADPGTQMGALANKAQFEKVQGLIEQGIAEGATLVCGGPGRPAGFNRGYFVKPTIFADVTPQMTIAREEIFGPVLSMMTYDTDDEAVAIANDTSYGLGGYVSAGTIEEAREVGQKIRAGRVFLNGAPANTKVPFGGYKQSGNGREHGVFGFEEFLEIKAMIGFQSA
ncbi:MAG: aldehyde dehydrogenase family protein [Bosea sp. (in: a-proteobacteria)]